MTDHVHDQHAHEAPHQRLMLVMMLGCMAIGALGIFYSSFYLDLAFVVSMGLCVGHHLWHRFRHAPRAL